MILVKSVIANPNTQTKCQWFKSSVTEVKKLFPERLDKLITEIRNGIDSASETAISLKEHLHIQVDDYVSWNQRGKDINELVVHVTVFVE